ncbi:hypothetical protein HAX54_040988, partial [Datura stramonium]|nr:hypothetical protein [Datura stramonium]
RSRFRYSGHRIATAVPNSYSLSLPRWNSNRYYSLAAAGIPPLQRSLEPGSYWFSRMLQEDHGDGRCSVVANLGCNCWNCRNDTIAAAAKF